MGALYLDSGYGEVDNFMDEFIGSVIANIVSNILWVLILSAVPVIFLLRNFLLGLLLGPKLRRAGVVSFFPDRDSYAKDRKLSLEDYVKTAKKTLCYAGHWLAVSADHRKILDSFEGVVRSEGRITIVMLDPNLNDELLAAYSKFFSRPREDLRQQISASWARIEGWKRTVGERDRQRITLKRHSEFVSNSAFFFDEGLKSQKILVDQKIWGLDRAMSFGLELACDPKKKHKSCSLFSRYANSIANLQQISTVVE